MALKTFSIYTHACDHSSNAWLDSLGCNNSPYGIVHTSER
jgi:hypothetical protein